MKVVLARGWQRTAVHLKNFFIGWANRNFILEVASVEENPG